MVLNHTGTEDRMKSVTDKFKIKNMVITMGGDGAILNINGDISRSKGFNVNVTDTVGRGDAFLAGLLSKLLDKTSNEALMFASRLDAFIATKRGLVRDMI